MSAFRIRDGRLPDDAQMGRDFILGLQAFEKTFEPDRRIDDTVAAEFFDVLMARAAEKQGRIFVAEDSGGAAIGWAVGFVDENEIYVEPEVRHFGYISELFVVEPWRGRGVGRALIASCESYFKSLKLKVMLIGVLSGNTRARSAYLAAGFSPYSEMLRKMI